MGRFLHGLSIILTLALASGPARAADSCENRLADLETVRRNMTQTTGHQTFWRGLNQYANLFKPDFLPIILANRHRPDFHWVDIGGGIGAALLESFAIDNLETRATMLVDYESLEVEGQHRVTLISIEDIFGKILFDEVEAERVLNEFLVAGGAFTEERKRREVRGHLRDFRAYRHIYEQRKGRFVSLSGRAFEDIPEGEIEPADLISDLYGGFTYSPRKFEVLRKAHDRLKPGGRAYHYGPEPYLLLGGREVPLPEYLDQNPIPGVMVKRLNFSVMIEIRQGDPRTREGLLELERRFTFQRLLPSLGGDPPHALYRLR